MKRPIPSPSSSPNFKYAAVGLGSICVAVLIWLGLRVADRPEHRADLPLDPQFEQATVLRETVVMIPTAERHVAPGREGEGVRTEIETATAGGTQECTGRVDSAAAQEAVRGHVDDVRRCFLDRASPGAPREGKATLRMQIDGQGRVEAVNAGGSLNERAVFTCMERLATNWEFSAPSDGECAEVIAPFRFMASRFE